MKPFRSHFLLCSLATALLLSSSAKAQTNAVIEAEQFLGSHDPLVGILGIPNVHNAVQGEAAKTLFGSQLQAIRTLYFANDPIAVEVLIPYLGYGSDDSLLLTPFHEGAKPTVNDVERTFPAFAAILSNPTAAAQLEKYVLDTDHPIERRFAAIQVLKFVDKKRFRAVIEKLERELAHAGPRTKTWLKAIRDNAAFFDGVHSVQTNE